MRTKTGLENKIIEQVRYYLCYDANIKLNEIWELNLIKIPQSSGHICAYIWIRMSAVNERTYETLKCFSSYRSQGAKLRLINVMKMLEKNWE